MFHRNCFVLLLSVVHIINSQQAVKPKYKCPSEGWMLKGRKCYKWGVSPRSYERAADYCSRENATLQFIESEEENEYFREDGTNTEYWLGITRDHRCWKIHGTNICINDSYTNWRMYPDPLKLYNPCSMWNSGDGKWTYRSEWDCQTDHLFICEQKAVCQDTYFGPNCTQECHCLGETCSTNFRCKYGCQRGWTGNRCSRRKQKPRALYYCFDTKNGGKKIIFRADLMGTRYRHVYGVDVNHVPMRTCSKSTFNQTGDRLMITIVANKDQFEPKCGEEKISEGTYKWKFDFKEFSTTRSAYDVAFEAVCTFKSANSVRRSVHVAVKGAESSIKLLDQSNVSVILALVDPYSGIQISSASLGSKARLVLSLRKKQLDNKMVVHAIKPHTCIATTDDGKDSLVLMDENGCVPEDSQVVLESGNGTSWWSKPFDIFSFPGSDHVQFSCQFVVCFEENYHDCSIESMCHGNTTVSPSPSPFNATNSTPVATRIWFT